MSGECRRSLGVVARRRYRFLATGGGALRASSSAAIRGGPATRISSKKDLPTLWRRLRGAERAAHPGGCLCLTRLRRACAPWRVQLLMVTTRGRTPAAASAEWVYDARVHPGGCNCYGLRRACAPAGASADRFATREPTPAGAGATVTPSPAYGTRVQRYHRRATAPLRSSSGCRSARHRGHARAGHRTANCATRRTSKTPSAPESAR